MGGNVFRPRPPSGKRERLCFGHGRKLEIAEKPPVAHKRNAELPNFRSSLVSETQNRSISVLPTPWKVRIAHFLRFQPLGKAKSLIFCASNPLESQKTGKNRLSSRDDERKTVKTAFHPRMKSEKREKERFRRGGKSESPNFHVSAQAENQKQIKTAFPPRRKIKNCQKLRFRPGGKPKTDKNGFSATAEKPEMGKNTKSSRTILSSRRLSGYACDRPDARRLKTDFTSEKLDF